MAGRTVTVCCFLLLLGAASFLVGVVCREMQEGEEEPENPPAIPHAHPNFLKAVQYLKLLQEGQVVESGENEDGETLEILIQSSPWSKDVEEPTDGGEQQLHIMPFPGLHHPIGMDLQGIADITRETHYVGDDEATDNASN